MSLALPMLIGGTLFLAVQHFLGYPAVIVVAVVLFGVELAHDLHLYRKPDRGVE